MKTALVGKKSSLDNFIVKLVVLVGSSIMLVKIVGFALHKASGLYDRTMSWFAIAFTLGVVMLILVDLIRGVRKAIQPGGPADAGTNGPRR